MLIDYETKKCVYENSNCVTKDKTYEEYVENIEEFCVNYIPNIAYRCNYSGGSCLENKKYCSEVTKYYNNSNNHLNDEICAKFLVSNSNKKCVYNNNNCVETDKNKSEILNNYFNLLVYSYYCNT